MEVAKGDRDKLRDALRDAMDWMKENDSLVVNLKVWKHIAAALAATESHDGWISVEDKPIPDGDWLVYLPHMHVGRHIHAASYEGSYRVIGGCFAHDLEAPPTHWMQLPDDPWK